MSYKKVLPILEDTVREAGARNYLIMLDRRQLFRGNVEEFQDRLVMRWRKAVALTPEGNKYPGLPATMLDIKHSLTLPNMNNLLDMI